MFRLRTAYDTAHLKSVVELLPNTLQHVLRNSLLLVRSTFALLLATFTELSYKCKKTKIRAYIPAAKSEAG